MDPFNIRMLLGGIGIFLFGMHTLESALQYLGGASFKKILHRYTDTAWKSITIGTLVTALLQSSSLVSLIAIAFVGAGVIKLSNAIGILIGANIGTTFTSLVIALIGFGKVSIAAFSFPMLAIGGILLISTKQQRRKERAKLLLGFGLLFLGLDFMKESVDALQQAFDLAAYASLSLPVFFLIGIVATIVLQSSSAVGVITLTALNSDIIGFPAGIAVVMGANIGTTITAVLGSFGGKTIKRQLALAQVLFNVISGVIGIVLFWPYIWLVQDVMGITDFVMGNAVLNFVFNVSTALIFAPFLLVYTRRIQRLVPDTPNNGETGDEYFDKRDVLS